MPEQIQGQVEIAALPEKTWDVVVVGAGPAGAVCALTLARLGRQVLVVDRERFPREKICGDLLIPNAISMLEQLGLFDKVRRVARQLNTTRVFSPSGIDLRVSGRRLSIRRCDFDNILMQAATGAGAAFVRGDVADVQVAPGRQAVIVVAHPARKLRARFCVLATGAAISIPRRLGMIDRAQPSALAIRCYVRSKSPLGDFVMFYDRRLLPGYAWINPLPNGEYNVGCGVALHGQPGTARNLKKILGDFMRTFPLARELLSRGRQVSAIRGAPLRCGLSGCRSLVKDNLVCIGEVIGTTYPFTCEGVGQAMHTAVVAGQVLHHVLQEDNAARLSEYSERLRSEIKPTYSGYEVAEKWLSRWWLNDFMIRRIRRSSYLQSQLERIIAEAGDPKMLFSGVKVLQSFWK